MFTKEQITGTLRRINGEDEAGGWLEDGQTPPTDDDEPGGWLDETPPSRRMPALPSDNYDRDLEDANEGFLDERAPVVPSGDSAASRQGISDADIEMMEYENEAEVFEAGYQDALKGKDPDDNDSVYMQGYEEGQRDRRSRKPSRRSEKMPPGSVRVDFNRDSSTHSWQVVQIWGPMSSYTEYKGYDETEAWDVAWHQLELAQLEGFTDAEIYYEGRVVSTRQTSRELVKEAISIIAQRAKISVWVGDLAAYNQGRLVGDWFELPVADVERDIINQVLEPNNEEFLIMDYETTLGIRINETDDLEELNVLAETVNDWEPDQLEVFPAALDIIRDREEAVDRVDSRDFVFVYAEDHVDLAASYIEETGMLDNVDENVSRYFDYAAFGSDLAMDFYETDNGYVRFD